MVDELICGFLQMLMSARERLRVRTGRCVSTHLETTDVTVSTHAHTALHTLISGGAYKETLTLKCQRNVAATVGFTT